MLLRPATPLTVLLLTAFVLLLLSVLSTPVVKSIPIATVDDIKFGIFGYCVGSNCSPIRVGYTSSEYFQNIVLFLFCLIFLYIIYLYLYIFCFKIFI